VDFSAIFQEKGRKNLNTNVNNVNTQIGNFRWSGALSRRRSSKAACSSPDGAVTISPAAVHIPANGRYMRKGSYIPEGYATLG
jgi:hypothetical protein